MKMICGVTRGPGLAILDRTKVWFRQPVLFCWLLVVCGSTSLVVAQDGNSLLRKRISELEAENRALRKILSEIKDNLSQIPKTDSAAAAGKSSGLRIVVLKDDWGDSNQEDMRRVCNSAAITIWKELQGDRLAPIHVSRSNSGPISLYRRGRGYEYLVKLDTVNRKWAQCAFQFAHEFCHILCNYRDVPNQQLWFEETLCECASLYALRSMSESWKTDAPYPNWKSYAGALKSYADNRIKKYDGQTESIAEFYRQQKSKLESNGTDRELNGYMAVRLLPLFEQNPKGWQAIRSINLGPQKENQSFESYFRGWYSRVEKRHQPFVKSLAKEFAIEIPSEKE